MYIEKINDNKIKVTVNKEDIKIWNVNMKNLTENTPEAQDLFWFALRQAEKDVDFKVGKEQLLVEAAPSGAEGFVMMISKMEPGTDIMDALGKGRPGRRPVEIRALRRSRMDALINIFKFTDFDSVCHCVAQLKANFSGKSSLYKYEDNFYLVLVPSDTVNFFEAENVIMEYSSRVQSPIITEGVLREHGTLMIEEFAFETILTYFS